MNINELRAIPAQSLGQQPAQVAPKSQPSRRMSNFKVGMIVWARLPVRK
jgi:hypothetical protein